MPIGIEVVFLGTAGSVPTKERGMPGISLTYDGSMLLFDCGEGTQLQMLRQGLNAQRLKAIFISHIHGDHTIGIAGLVRSLAINGRREALYIYVPTGYENMIKRLITFDKALIGYTINVIGAKSGTVYRGRGFSVSAFRLKHTVETCGYAFKEDDRLRFIKSECDRLGIKGTLFSELERKGSIKVNGRRVRIAEVTRLQKGRKIVYATDTRPVKSTVSASINSELLIHEASYTDGEAELARSRGHSTAAEAAGIAKKAHAKRLAITHFSARYKEPAELLNQARRVFRNTVAVSDGYRMTL